MYNRYWSRKNSGRRTWSSASAASCKAGRQPQIRWKRRCDQLPYVEDNDDNIYMLETRLELLGDFEVLTAENGERGCEVAAAERPDIILMES